ncbi:hypothetical protein Hdeb2414_s0015g00450701 [Helianthus debilis subsp. tardiflorus]
MKQDHLPPTHPKLRNSPPTPMNSTAASPTPELMNSPAVSLSPTRLLPCFSGRSAAAHGGSEQKPQWANQVVGGGWWAEAVLGSYLACEFVKIIDKGMWNVA